MLLWASISASFCSVNSHTDGYLFEGGDVQIIVLGSHPKFRKNGVYPVLSECAEFMVNSIVGSFMTQSVWLE